jgi:chemotaxis protein MotA
MDLGTIGGIALGVILIFGPIITGPGGLGSFIDIGSIMITVGGAIAALLIAIPLPKVKEIMGVTQKIINSGSLEITPWYNTVVEMATIARRDGILALEDKLDAIENDFLKKGLQMLVDGSAAEVVTAILEQEIAQMENRHVTGQTIWKNLGAYCPAFGMIGTLIGLIQMLQDLSDPSKVGAGMAVALLTTLYGAFVANLFCIPIQGKLEQRTEEEVQLKNMLFAGIVAIQSGDSPRVVGDKLLTYLPPAEKAKIIAEANG